MLFTHGRDLLLQYLTTRSSRQNMCIESIEMMDKLFYDVVYNLRNNIISAFHRK